MNDRAADIAQARGKPRVAEKSVLVAQVAEDAVERRSLARSARVEHHLRARVEELHALGRPVAAEIGLKVPVLRAADAARGDARRCAQQLEAAIDAQRA